MATDMAAGLKLYEPNEAARVNPALRTDDSALAMYSPLEIRVESKTAIPKLAGWLAEAQNVDFYYGETALETSAGRLRTTLRAIDAGRVVLCPGTELTGLAASAISAHALRLTRLQMLRVRPRAGFTLGAAVMSDLGLIRYGGYAVLPTAAALKERLVAEEYESLAAGIHLIVVQSADGTLVVGDSHHYDASPEPFASERVDQLILHHMHEALHVGECEVLERWTGIYPTGADVDCVIEHPDAETRVVVVSSGTGASTAFAIAEEVFNEWG
jgi:D-hydroxyproline dehydrogenase subunit beta